MVKLIIALKSEGCHESPGMNTEQEWILDLLGRTNSEI